MNAISLSWGVMGASMLLVASSGFALCWQALLRREAFAALRCCQVQQKQLQAKVYQQDAGMREFTAGLRGEKAHVEQLQRQAEFAREQVQRLQESI